jgi:hypothetical protein
VPSAAFARPKQNAHKHYNCRRFSMRIVSNVRLLAAERLALRSLTRWTTIGRPTERAVMYASREIKEYPGD